ncbi:type I-F CRISPR-associated endonuclease Cas1f [Thermithiobacillus tepidarius DSM 3134]|uniref:type I-F CRISPR-associated endonuclease Cas1f n=1 Tax=Thermithiobacillus tepidarius TaxID=929 RepID=UPI003AABD0A0
MSKRANVFYLEHARVMVKDDRVIYLTEFKGGVDRAFNIPDRNTAFLLLGKGTSITDGAARKLAESGVIIGFCGSGGSPLLSAVDVVFLPPQSEYRPTEYMQNWMGIWTDDAKRLDAAKFFLNRRLDITLDAWDCDPELRKVGAQISDVLERDFRSKIKRATDTGQLLSAEGTWAKELYATLARAFKLDDFAREEGRKSRDGVPAIINSFLDHGNYIAYGYAAVALYALGISFAMPLLHGKTRRGALVFDVADLVKDATVMPLAFSMGTQRAKDQDFRNALTESMQKAGVVDTMIETIKQTFEKAR